MKKLLLTAALAVIGSMGAQAQVVISQWTFDSTTLGTPTPGAGVALAGIGADTGTGTASGLHAGNSTYSTPAGDGSVKSLSSNTWAIGDYYQFTLATTSYTGIFVTWNQFGSGTGPANFKLQYSTDGITYADVSGGAYTVLGTPAWNATTYQSATTYSYDLSSLTGLDNAAAIGFRLVDTSTTNINGTAVATAGTDRVDNFTVSQGLYVIPEPSTYALFGMGVIGLVVLRRMRKGIQV